MVKTKKKYIKLFTKVTYVKKNYSFLGVKKENRASQYYHNILILLNSCGNQFLLTIHLY